MRPTYELGAVARGCNKGAMEKETQYFINWLEPYFEKSRGLVQSVGLKALAPSTDRVGDQVLIFKGHFLSPKSNECRARLRESIVSLFAMKGVRLRQA